MSDRVLPAWGRVSVVGKLPSHKVVDPLHRKLLGGGTFHRHEDHTGKGQRRLTGIVFTVVLAVTDIQNDIDHLVRAAWPPGLVLVRLAIPRLGLSRSPASSAIASLA